MDDGRIDILLVEDSAGDARLIEDMLAQARGLKYALTWVDNLTDAIAHLRGTPTDVLLLDLGLPESSGLDTVHALAARVPALPTLIVLSGLGDEDSAVQAVQAGAQDYLVKGHVDSSLLVRAIRYALERSQAKRALQQANDELERRVAERTAELAGTIVALHAEIAEREQAEARIRYMAHHDALTGLPNRELLQDRLAQAIAYAHRHGTKVALLFIGLDNFKQINDTLGHSVGDRLLQLVAARLQLGVREGDSLARSGGDEYALCLASPIAVAEAARVAQAALDALSEPYDVQGSALHVGASIGISFYPEDGADVSTLMRAADTAMNHVKARGRGGYHFFTQALNQAAQHRVAMEGRLRQALAKGELLLHYQPQVDMASGAIFSCEALLRWRRDGAEPVSCPEFIAIAEETGLILPLGEWLLRQACGQLKQWQQDGYPQLRMAVNVSPRQFYQPHFCDMIVAILAEAGLAANSLELEITESLLLQRSDEVLDILNRLGAMGIALSVDDFGTGYCGLAYLQRFPVHALKIDQSFVQAIGRDRHAAALITAIVSMGNSLDLKVLAEGVETAQQVDFLLSHGCRTAQGFYYSAAVPADAFVTLLSKHNHG